MTPTLKAKLREELGSLTSDAKLARVYRAVLEGIREQDINRIAILGALCEDTLYVPQDLWREIVDALLSQGEAVE